ncbi:MAG: hypothetical protein ABJZ55_09920, partial [Fuerstiella sp.]
LHLHVDKMPELRFAWSGLRVRGKQPGPPMLYMDGIWLFCLRLIISRADYQREGTPITRINRRAALAEKQT